jgi:hypothetical protein
MQVQIKHMKTLSVKAQEQDDGGENPFDTHMKQKIKGI